jgi:hypothetical protein
MKPQVIYFISETAPTNTHASFVVFYRHFKRLAAQGCRIIWITDQNSLDYFGAGYPEEWEMCLLPNRAWHLPPYRPRGLSQRYRYQYYYRKIAGDVIARTPHAVLITHLNGQFLAPFAAFVAEKTGLPLVTFYHDDIMELNFFKGKNSLLRNTRKVLEASSCVLIASEAFRQGWPEYAAKFELLYPIPAAEEKPAHARPPGPLTLGYAGAIYDEIVPCLGQLAVHCAQKGYRMILIGDTIKTMPLAARYPDTVKIHDLFATPEESGDYLLAHCHAGLITYPLDPGVMPWIMTCFPSKFPQYCQWGLPALIIAPRGSAIGQWCTIHHWLLYSQSYAPESLEPLFVLLDDAEVKQQVAQHRNTTFDPENIQNHFGALLTSLCHD